MDVFVLDPGAGSVKDPTLISILLLECSTFVSHDVPLLVRAEHMITDKQDNLAEAAQEFVKPKVVGKVLELPVVNDAYDSLLKLSSPLNPYVEKIGRLASPAVDQALDFSASIEGKVPDVVQTSYASALKKVSLKNINLNPNALTLILKAATMAASLDATLCSGVDNLVEKVPALNQATPTLYNSTRCVS